MTKGETIEYAIQKECQRFSLVDWCESWDITQAFNSDEMRERNYWE